MEKFRVALSLSSLSLSLSLSLFLSQPIDATVERTTNYGEYCLLEARGLLVRQKITVNY